MASSSQLAFVLSSGQLATIDADGRNLRILSAPGRRYAFPAWSPQGQMLAVSYTEGMRYGLNIIPLDRPERMIQVTQSVSEPPSDAYWTPDGRAISFLTAHPLLGKQLWYAEGSEEPRCLATAPTCAWQWSPTSDWLLAQLGDQIVRLDPSGETQLLIRSEGATHTPAISPSSQYWAYVAERAGEHILALEGRHSTRTTLRLAGDATLAWSPQRDLLAFISAPLRGRNWYGALQTLYPGSPTPRLLQQASIIAFFWSPDGRMIATIALDQASFSQTSALELPMLLLQLSVVDLARQRVRTLLNFEPQPSFYQEWLPKFDQYAHSHMLWSPDSQRLVIPLLEAGEELLAIVPVDGSPPWALAAGGMPSWSM